MGMVCECPVETGYNFDFFTGLNTDSFGSDMETNETLKIFTDWVPKKWRKWIALPAILLIFAGIGFGIWKEMHGSSDDSSKGTSNTATTSGNNSPAFQSSSGAPTINYNNYYGTPQAPQDTRQDIRNWIVRINPDLLNQLDNGKPEIHVAISEPTFLKLNELSSRSNFSQFLSFKATTQIIMAGNNNQIDDFVAEPNTSTTLTCYILYPQDELRNKTSTKKETDNLQASINGNVSVVNNSPNITVNQSVVNHDPLPVLLHTVLADSNRPVSINGTTGYESVYILHVANAPKQIFVQLMKNPSVQLLKEPELKRTQAATMEVGEPMALEFEYFFVTAAPIKESDFYNFQLAPPPAGQ